jgi:hypothetical protein
LWLRLSSSQFEARIGLQKINFGSATIFRPLMWFDRIDPRDPLQITDGVYGALLRYYFVNNANIWLWGLLGNRDTKGWETIATQKGSPEFGGRVQTPLFKGELALTFHQRHADPGENPPWPAPSPSSPFLENRCAVDGKWDVGVGIWFEAALIHQHDRNLPYPWQRMLSCGLDYTFKLGRGLYLLAEQYLFQQTATCSGPGTDFTCSALLSRYPLGLLDSLAAIFYYDWKNKKAYSFFSWQRTYDRWQGHLMLFCNPRQSQISQVQSGNNYFGGLGCQVLVVWNI